MPAPIAEQIETLNGIQLYIEVRGSGEPLVLLHGFMGSSMGSSYRLVIVARGMADPFSAQHSCGRPRKIVQPVANVPAR
jgi:pimeloyl-ACP methyl ester carboxylesterase